MQRYRAADRTQSAVLVVAEDEERRVRAPVTALAIVSVVSRLLILVHPRHPVRYRSSHSLALARSVVIGHNVHEAVRACSANGFSSSARR